MAAKIECWNCDGIYDPDFNPTCPRCGEAPEEGEDVPELLKGKEGDYYNVEEY